MAGFTISVRHGFDALLAGVEARQKDVEFWHVAALTATAQDVQAAEVAKASEVFDRPTRFTLNAFYIKPATRSEPVAEVRFKEGFGSIPAWRFLGPQVEGGGRVKKSHERALERAGILRPGEYVVPGRGVTLDANGNMKGGEITRILSQLGAAEHSAGYDANATKKSLARAKRKGVGRYILLRPDLGDPRSKVYGRRAHPGIYWRKGGREIVPVLIFVKPPRYTKRFPFYETARQVVQRRYAANFRAMMAKYPPRPVRTAA